MAEPKVRIEASWEEDVEMAGNGDEGVTEAIEALEGAGEANGNAEETVVEEAAPQLTFIE